MKLSFNALAGIVLSSVVIATGGIAWSADRENAVQTEQIEKLEARAEKTEELIRQLDKTSTDVAVLSERIRQLLERERARE